MRCPWLWFRAARVCAPTGTPTVSRVACRVAHTRAGHERDPLAQRRGGGGNGERLRLRAGLGRLLRQPGAVAASSAACCCVLLRWASRTGTMQKKGGQGTCRPRPWPGAGKPAALPPGAALPSLGRCHSSTCLQTH